MTGNIFDVLQERNFIEAVTHEEIRDLLGREKVTVYAGFDPTSDSLHVGHLLPVMALAYFQRP